ncbi:MAG: tRNA uridine-5-carboxymethylaminomethyl(34) synthesis enzyme MnmG, partial [Bacteroidia bacterium]
LEKQEGIKQIKKYLAKTKVSMDNLNTLLNSLNSSPVTQSNTLKSIIGRPNISIESIINLIPETADFLMNYDEEIREAAEIAIKYEGYIEKEQEMVDKISRLENIKIHPNVDFKSIQSLSSEARDKLTKIRPLSIGQASRISGVSPSDISVLLVHLGR